jgi:hypothetical protein
MERLTNNIDYYQLHCDFGKEKDCLFTDKSKCYENNMYNKLREYEIAEEEGLLINLPCKIGDSLYQPIRNVINEYKVIGICYDIEKNKWLFEVAYQLGLEWFKTVCEFKAIGKTVFLTKKEAEQALEQMGE